MTHFRINIAKRYTESDWQGKPAHRHFAKFELSELITSSDDATNELRRLQAVYPWPEYHMTLRKLKQVTHSTAIASTAPETHLAQLNWKTPSIHEEA